MGLMSIVYYHPHTHTAKTDVGCGGQSRQVGESHECILRQLKACRVYLVTAKHLCEE